MRIDFATHASIAGWILFNNVAIKIYILFSRKVLMGAMKYVNLLRTCTVGYEVSTIVVLEKTRCFEMFIPETTLRTLELNIHRAKIIQV